MRKFIRLMTRHRVLIWEMTRREIGQRYAGQVLGSLWAIGHPIFLMGLYVFVFAFVFPTRFSISETMPRDLVTYILAGLIPWLTFSESMGKGTGVILAHSGLVKQVLFPIEILPVKVVLATFLTQIIATATLLVYMFALGGGWPFTVVILPLLFFFQILAMIGVGYFLSAVGVYFRDLKDIVQVFLTAGLFLAPILYLPHWLSKIWLPFHVILFLNPFSHLVWCYQDLLYYGRFQHGWSWVVIIVLSIGVFYGGYWTFRRLNRMFGDLL